MLRAQCYNSADTQLALMIPRMEKKKYVEKVSEYIIEKNLNGDQTQQREWGNQEEINSFCLIERQYLW